MVDQDFVFGSGGDWSLPENEAARQAIAPLGGYVYQFHATLAAWLQLPGDAELHLEAAEDYAEIASDPSSLERVLAATQVKNTRESGSVTLNSQDVKDAIANFWKLKAANAERPVVFNFLTTSPVGREHKAPLPDRAGLEEWRWAAKGGDCAEIRKALAARIPDGDLADFVRDSSDEDLRNGLLRPVRWLCGAPRLDELIDGNRSAVISRGHEVGVPPDMAERATDALIGRILRVITTKGARVLRQGDLLAIIHRAGLISAPARVVMAGYEAAASRGLDLDKAGVWRVVGPAAQSVAQRAETVDGLAIALREDGALWLHGATGLGKTTVAELLSRRLGGPWYVLDLRGVKGEAIAERLVAARRLIAGLMDLGGVILDDIDPAISKSVEPGLADLRSALDRRDGVLIATSYDPPGARITTALKLTSNSIKRATSFTALDTADFVGRLGGDPAIWAPFVWVIGGGGHPQLVDVVARGLAARSWPMEEMERLKTNHFNNADVAGERETARNRLLAELEDNERDLLTRASRIMGFFDRKLAVEVAAMTEAVPKAGQALDRLTGPWIERVLVDRMRTSPLVSDLAQAWLGSAELERLDRHIAEAILKRKLQSPDLLDTAFAHSLAAKATDQLWLIARMLLTAKTADRPLVATFMPTFRMAESSVVDFMVEHPYVGLFLRMAQHRLTAAVAEPEGVAASAGRVLEQWMALPDAALRARLGPMVHYMVLIDEFAFGKLPDWFAWVRRLASIPQSEDSLSMTEYEGANGETAAEFAFLAHAIHLPGTAALERLFDELDVLPDTDRAAWLKTLRADRAWLSMMIDNPWLKQSESADFDAQATADLYARLGNTALEWGETRLAARCFRTRAMTLDEYLQDRDAADEALDEAERFLPNHVELQRERAKIAWRARDYRGALEQHRRLAKRLDEFDPFDAAFAMREGAVSAGELRLWPEAAEMFERARVSVLAGTQGNETAMSVGLAVDAAAAIFEAGDCTGGVRALADALERVQQLQNKDDPKSRAVQRLAGHVVLWMTSRIDGKVTLDGERIEYVVGAASNPGPHKALSEGPILPLDSAWMLLSRAALRAGLSMGEIVAWPGVTAMRAYPDLETLFRLDVVEEALSRGDMGDLVDRLLNAASARENARGRSEPRVDTDPNALRKGDIPVASLERVEGNNARRYARQTAATFAGVQLLSARDSFSLGSFAGTLTDRLGIDIVPEWSGPPIPDTGEAQSELMIWLRKLEAGEIRTPMEIYYLHLRLWDELRYFAHADVLWSIFAERVQSNWTEAIATKAALFKSPMTSVPPLRQALEASDLEHPKHWIGRVLLAAEAAVPIDLGAEFRAALAE